MKSKIISILKNLFEKNWVLVLVLLVKVISVYLMSFLLLFGVCKLLMGKEIVLYLLVMSILVGLVLDTRIEGIRKVIFSVLLVLHVVFGNYGYGQTEIVGIKEIFWYSLVMLGCFVGHVLILEGLFKMVDSLKWDYGRYMVSRISLTSSMMGIIGILQGIIYILGMKNTYESEKGYKEHICNGNKLLEAFIYILLAICEYFSFIFQGYAKLIIGKGEMIRLREIPIKYYVFIIVTLYISYTIGVPRIYLIGIALIIWNLINTLQTLNKFKVLHQKYNAIVKEKEMIFIDELVDAIIIEIKIKRNKKRVTDKITDVGKLLYSPALYEEYLCYSKLNYGGEISQGNNTNIVVDIYHPGFDVFNYSEDRLLKILGRVEYLSWICYQSYGTTNPKIRKIDDVYRDNWDEEEETEALSVLLKDTQSYINRYGFQVKAEELIEYMKKAEEDCLLKNKFESVDEEVARFQTGYQYIMEKNFKY